MGRGGGGGGMQSFGRRWVRQDSLPPQNYLATVAVFLGFGRKEAQYLGSCLDNVRSFP